MGTPGPNTGERPAHPKAKGFLVMVAVLLAVMALAAMSTFAGH